MIQILRFAVVLVVLIKSKCQDIPDLTLVLQRQSYRGYNVTCIVSDNSMDSAITWNEPVPSQAYYTRNYVSQYLPTRKGSYNCDINDDDRTECNRQWVGEYRWSLQNSLSSNLGPVLDKRWEDFPITHTDGYLNFNKIAEIKNQQQFKLHFSSRTQEAHVYICDNEKPNLGSCYWFILGGWSGNATALRKCYNGQIPKRDGIYPEEPCFTPIARIIHAHDAILHKDEWRHFTIEKHNNNVILWQMGNSKPILNYTNNEENINTAYLIVNSRKIPGYWKVHDYYYAFTRSKGQSYIGPDISVTDDNLCMSMFVGMCAKCSLMIEVLYYAAEVYDFRSVKTVLITPRESMMWQEEKIVVKLPVVRATVRLRIHPQCSDCDNQFWAIDNFQICTEKEIRVLTKTQDRDKLLCQAIKYRDRQLTQTDVDSDNAPVSTCPNGTFGKKCLNCETVFGGDNLHCDKSIVCEFQSVAPNICRCTNGYTGATCEQKCSNGFYGFNCKNQCGYCQFPPCHYITGRCAIPKCLHNFTGDLCKTAPLPVLLNPPEIIEVKATTLKVQIQNTTHEGLGKPIFYKLQYRQDLQKEWMDVSRQYPLSYTHAVDINNLKRLTYYEVRAVLITENGQSYDYEYVPKASVTTKCEFIEENNIKTNIFNTSVILMFEENIGSCPPEDYEIVINRRKISSDTLTFEINKLEPFTDYILKITNKKTEQDLAITLKTEEGVSTKVESLKTTDNDATSIAVSWNAPATPNGNIRYYKVQYEQIRYNGCEKNTNENSRKTFEVHNTTSIVLRNLIPYSQYRIKVVAFTVIDGEYHTTFTNTEPTESPDETEIPTISNTEAESSSVTIRLQQPDCILIKGPAQYFVTLRCSDDWCEQSLLTRNISNINYNQPLEIQQLLPYSNYTVEIKVGRLNGNVFEGKSMTAMFTTKSSVPNPIRDLVAYSRNETSVFLRWSPPYPPTGKLKDYFIAYCYDKSNWGWQENVCDSHYFDIMECQIWKNKHCFALHRLEKDQSYSIRISSKNTDTDFGVSTNTEAKTKQDVPGAPENLSAAWDNYYNFSVTWNHPSITNGPLTKFILKIYSDTGAGVCHMSSFDVKEDTYNLTYTYVIPFPTTLCLSSKLTVYVSAFNNEEGPSVKRENVYSPPITPSFSSKPTIQHVSNTTIVLNVPTIVGSEKDSIAYFIVSANDIDEEVNKNTKGIQEIWKKSELPLHSSKWIAAEYDLRKTSVSKKTFTVGNDMKVKSERLNIDIYNRPLQVHTEYTITILLINKFRVMERYSVYRLTSTTEGMKPEGHESSNYALLALLLLLLIPVLFWILIRRQKEGKMNIPWSSLLGTANNPTRNNSNPDVIPLATNTDKKPVVSAKPISVRPKHTMPVEHTSTPSSSTGVVNDTFSKPIKITEFEKYVKDSIESGELERQHGLFPRGQTQPWDYGLLPQNKSKNRYNNLIAYDHTRVRLAKINNDKFSDYINANYVQGYNTNNAYIATQGPKASTVNDFWRMIWQENVNCIVMLANIIEGGKKKTEQYWPNVNEFIEFGKIKVEYISSQVFADYEYRTFSVSYENNERRVEQLHFTSWPDHGVPLYSQSLVPFLRKLLTIPQGTSPIVVHCSAGVGRTGTIILCDLCLRMAAREGIVDVLKHQHNLREQRANLVDNVEQYKLAHLVLLQCLIAPETSITCDEEMEKTVLNLLESGKLKDQIHYLSDTAWQDEAMRPVMEVSTNTEWETKNRFPDIVPSGYGRIYLPRYPATVEHSDYINAVEVDGFRSPQRFIATQQPMPHTISDFWRMIDEKEVTTIVSLNKINKEDKTSCIFWPTEEVNELQPVSYISLKFHENIHNEYFNVVAVNLQNNKSKKHIKRTVHVIVLKTWPANKFLPKTEESLLKLWEETEKVSRGYNPIVVTCYDGATACGLFLALSFIVEKMKLEQQCDVCLAVRTIRPNRKQFVTDTEQFTFLYRAAISYLSSFDLYSNFTSITGKT